MSLSLQESFEALNDCIVNEEDKMFKDKYKSLAELIEINNRGEMDAIAGYENLIARMKQVGADPEDIEDIKHIIAEEKEHNLMLNKMLMKYDGIEPKEDVEESTLFLSEVGTIGKVLIGFKINGADAGSTAKRISILKAHKNDRLLNYINKCKSIDELDYIRKDCHIFIYAYNNIGERIDKINKEGNSKETRSYYKGIYNDYIKHGITSKDCKLIVKWCRDVVLPAIFDRRKELVKNKK